MFLLSRVGGQAEETGQDGWGDRDCLPLGKVNSGHQAESCQKKEISLFIQSDGQDLCPHATCRQAGKGHALDPINLSTT